MTCNDNQEIFLLIFAAQFFKAGANVGSPKAILDPGSKHYLIVS